MSKVSIIVPVYNSEKTLKKCVDAILRQTYIEWELLLIDDGSTDGSGVICDEYKYLDSRIQVIHNQNNGVSITRNIGIQHATGEYIMFCDSDDFVESTWCEDLVNMQKENPDSMVISNYYRYRDNSIEINYELECEKLKSRINKKDFFSLYPYELLGTPWNKIYLKEHIIENKILFDEKLSLGEDLLFNLDYINCLEKDVIFIKKPLYYYYLGNVGSLSVKYYSNLDKIYEYLFKKIKESLLASGSFSKYDNFYYFSYFYAIDRVFRNIWSEKNKSSMTKKIKDCKKIFDSEEFTECKRRVQRNQINVLQYIGLKSNCFFIYWMSVLISEKISYIIHKMRL